ncbi:MAG: hypothetical protein IKO47_01040 [Ruminococcus sp.]|nr:hypothetical protein [Ruminococcus sp.]
MKKIIALSIAGTLLSSLASCSSSSDSSTPGSTDSASVTASSGELTSAPAETAASTELSEEPSTAEAHVYAPKEAGAVTAADKDTVTELCSEMCRSWGSLCSGYPEKSMRELIQYNAFYSYLESAAANHSFQTIPDDSSYFEPVSFDISGGYAIARGVCKSRNAAYGEYIFIISATEKGLLVNDMMINTEDSHDHIYRPGLVSSPAPDYWKDNSITVSS